MVRACAQYIDTGSPKQLMEPMSSVPGQRDPELFFPPDAPVTHAYTVDLLSSTREQNFSGSNMDYDHDGVLKLTPEVRQLMLINKTLYHALRNEIESPKQRARLYRVHCQQLATWVDFEGTVSVHLATCMAVLRPVLRDHAVQVLGFHEEETFLGPWEPSPEEWRHAARNVGTWIDTGAWLRLFAHWDRERDEDGDIVFGGRTTRSPGPALLMAGWAKIQTRSPETINFIEEHFGWDVGDVTIEEYVDAHPSWLTETYEPSRSEVCFARFLAFALHTRAPGPPLVMMDGVAPWLATLVDHVPLRTIRRLSESEASELIFEKENITPLGRAKDYENVIDLHRWNAVFAALLKTYRLTRWKWNRCTPLFTPSSREESSDIERAVAPKRDPKFPSRGMELFGDLPGARVDWKQRRASILHDFECRAPFGYEGGVLY